MRWLIFTAASCAVSAFAQVSKAPAGDVSLDSLLNIRITTASKHWETVSEAPASVTIVPSEDFVKFGYRTLADVLGAVRGFYASYDRNYNYIGVRGFSRPTDYNDRILLLLNGHTMNDGFDETSPFGTDFGLDLNSVERIEIVRGPGSVMYGSGAVFAVVNVITRRGSEFNHVQVQIDGGSYGTLRGSLLAGKEFDNGTSALMSAQWTNVDGHDLYYKEYDGDSTNHGIAHNIDWDHHYAVFSSLESGPFALQGFWSSRLKGVPTASFGTNFNDGREHTLDQYGVLDLTYAREFSPAAQLTLRGYFDHYYYTGSYPYVLDQIVETTTNRLGGEARVRWDINSANRVTAGVECIDNLRADYHNMDASTVYLYNDFPYSIVSLYGQDEYQITGALSATLGLRWDSYSTGKSAVSPRGGFLYHPGVPTTLKLLYGEAFRAPSQYESNYEDELSGFKVNHALDPERIRTLELVCEERLAQEWFGTVSVYGNRIENLIDQAVDPADSLLHFANVSAATAVGLECELKARLRQGISGYASYSYQHATEKGTGNHLTNSPMHLIKAGVSVTPLPFLQAALDADYESGRLTVQGTTTAPFVLTNMRVVARAPGNRGEDRTGILDRFILALTIRNLFNAAYANPGGFEHMQAAIPQDGRNYLMTLGFTL